MKKGIHPEYHPIIYVTPDGREFPCASTMGKAGEVFRLQLDIDSYTHPAWTGSGSTANLKADRVTKFGQKFGGIGFGVAAAATANEKTEDKKEG